MKHFLLLAFIILPFTSFAQLTPVLDKKTGQITFTDVVDVKGIPQTELYNRIKTFYSTGTSSKEQIQLTDGAAGNMVGKAFMDVIINDGITTEKQRLWYTILVELHDAKFRYVLKELSLQRYCIPAKQIACEEQTKPVAVEDLLKLTARSAKKSPAKAYSLESQLGKAASNLVTSLTKSALTERHIAGLSPE
jgi:hypothetical protein